MKKLLVTALLCVVLVFGLVACTGDYSEEIAAMQQKIADLEAKNELLADLQEELSNTSQSDRDKIGILEAQIALINGKIEYNPNKTYKLNEKITIAYNGYKLYEVWFESRIMVELQRFYICAKSYTNPAYIGDTFFVCPISSFDSGFVGGGDCFGEPKTKLSNTEACSTIILYTAKNNYKLSYQINTSFTIPIANINFSQSA